MKQSNNNLTLEISTNTTLPNTIVLSVKDKTKFVSTNHYIRLEKI